MEKIVEIVGFTTKIDIALIKLVVEILFVSKIDVFKTNVEGRFYSSVDEVVDTLVNVVLS